MYVIAPLDARLAGHLPAPCGAPRRPRATRPLLAHELWLCLHLVPLLWLGACGREGEPRRNAASSNSRAAAVQSRPPARYVGKDVCAECHAEQTRLWAASDHARAMAPANESTVLGDFHAARFTAKDGTASSFYRDNGRFWIRTDGPDGKLRDFAIAYTFGFRPLQQYLVEFPRGRLQAFGLCWDARPAAVGGQRCFHIYPEEKVDWRDILHWTGPMQNWNYMCSECHSTNPRKGYVAERDSFATTWSEIMVSCEACHGPGSRHVDWARSVAAGGAGAPGAALGKGLDVVLPRHAADEWIFDPGQPTARRAQPRTTDAALETCARCHSRRTQLTDDYVFRRPISDSHRIALLDPELYHADGQILEEVYEYGSFLQSRMQARGVTCTDCHDAHTGELPASPDQVCSRCHLEARYATERHHFHQAGSPGASCIECHMPARTYMVVDARRDHSFRVPRPDLSTRIGTPNACNGCHTDKSATWAAARIVERYGPASPSRRPHYGEAIDAGRNWKPEAEKLLAATLASADVPGIARATALVLLSDYWSPASLPLAALAVKDADPLVRRAAAQALAGVEPRARADLVAPLLRDPVLSVRLDAVSAAADILGALVGEELFGVDLFESFAAAVREYEAVQRFNADRSEAHLNLGALYAQTGRPGEAESEYRTAIRLQPSFVPTYVNLADLYREQGREADAERLLRAGLQVAAEAPDLHHALGLSLVRQGRQPEALAHLAQAARLGPAEPRYAYVYGVGLQSAGSLDEARRSLETAHRRFPAHREILVALVATSRDAGDLRAALAWAQRLVDLVPEDPAARQLLQEIGAVERAR